MNSIFIEGRIGSDVILKYTPSGVAALNFSLAHNYFYKEKQTTSWFRVNIFKGYAEKMSQVLKKGDLIFVSGRCEVKEFKTKDGQVKTNVEIYADSIRVLATPPKVEKPQQQTFAESAQLDTSWTEDDMSVPF